MAQNILKTFSQIRTFVFDMDGVLTQGKLLVMGNDAWYREMNVKDGYALQLAIRCGYKIFVISGSNAPEAGERLNRLGISGVFFNVKDKRAFLIQYFSENAIDVSTALYMGDDVPDGDAMQLCSLSACPADAVREVLYMAKYISPFGGGNGCVRDVIEKVLRLNNDWTPEPRVAST